MRTLKVNEMNAVSGGTPGEILFGCVIGMVITSMYHYATSGHCKTLFEQHPFYYDVTTPVYDAYGAYQGDIVDTYQDFNYVPVTVCVA